MPYDLTVKSCHCRWQFIRQIIHRQLFTDSSSPTTSSTTHHQQLFTDSSSPTTLLHRQVFTDKSSPTSLHWQVFTDNSSPTALHRQVFADKSSPTTRHRQLFTDYCMVKHRVFRTFKRRTGHKPSILEFSYRAGVWCIISKKYIQNLLTCLSITHTNLIRRFITLFGQTHFMCCEETVLVATQADLFLIFFSYIISGRHQF